MRAVRECQSRRVARAWRVRGAAARVWVGGQPVLTAEGVEPAKRPTAAGASAQRTHALLESCVV